MMSIDSLTMLLNNSRYCPSPNFNVRPEGMEIDLLVIHNISLPPGEFGGRYIDDFFTNILDKNAHPYFAEIYDRKVSCHCFIARTGAITQYIPFHLRAWHAGVSSYLGRENCNDFSIGIELEGTDELAYTGVQYATLVELIIELQKLFPKITRERIVGHSTIAPDRKTDPGQAFDWDRLWTMMRKSKM